MGKKPQATDDAIKRDVSELLNREGHKEGSIEGVGSDM